MIEAIKFALRYDPSPNPRVGAVLVDKNNKIKKITAHKEKNKDHAEYNLFKNSDILGQAGFGWPSIKKNETGKFWNNLLDEREADRIIDYILNVNEEDWANDLNSISDVMSFDDGNSFFVKMLNNLK